MRARIPKALYDYTGRLTSNPLVIAAMEKRACYPMHIHLNCIMTWYHRTYDELRAFLRGCRYRSDEEAFGRQDFWIPPSSFQSRREGDCEDFALYTWRQLLHLGYDARLVLGEHGSMAHAWCTAKIKGRFAIIDPVNCHSNDPFLFYTLKYRPQVSVASFHGHPLHYLHVPRSGWRTAALIVYLVCRAVYVAAAIAVLFSVLFFPFLIRNEVKAR